jgi:hypothetical protein
MREPQDVITALYRRTGSTQEAFGWGFGGSLRLFQQP